jgi:hypothetical protein
MAFTWQTPLVLTAFAVMEIQELKDSHSEWIAANVATSSTFSVELVYLAQFEIILKFSSPDL